MSLIYGYDNNKACSCSGSNIKTFKTSITFTKYNNRNIVKVFDTGIILMRVVTTSGRVSPAHAGQVYYKFCSVDGKTLVRKIYSYNGNYFNILNKDTDDKVINVRDIYTVPNVCSITVELATHSRAGRAANAEPPGPVKLNITLFYMEFPAFNYNVVSGGSGGSTLAF